MKKIIPLLLFMAVQLSAFSQDISIITGKGQSPSYGVGAFTVADEEAFYVSGHIEGSSSSFVVTKYSSKTLDEIYSKKIKVPEVNGKECDVKAVVLAEGTLLLFTTQFDKTDGLNKLYANKFRTDGTIDEESKLIASVKPLNKKLQGYFKVEPAGNMKSIIVCTEMGTAETENIKYIWKILDKNLNTTLESSMELPHYSLSNPSVRKMDYKNGKVYFISWRLKDVLKSKEKDKSPAVNKFYCYDLNNQKLTEVVLDVAHNSLFDVGITFNTKNQVILTGLYSTQEGGYFFFAESAYNRIESGAFCEVYTDGLEKVLYKDILANDGSGYLYYVNDVLLQADGTVILVSERKDLAEYGSSTQPHHKSGDVLIHSFNPETKEKWLKRISKDQQEGARNDLFSTLALSASNNLAFVINDNRKNTLGNAITFADFGLIDKNVQTKVLLADKKGNLKENHSVTSFEGDTLVYCMINKRISPSEIIVIVKTSEGRRIAKLTLK
jgi:hypothetical protein